LTNNKPIISIQKVDTSNIAILVNYRISYLEELQGQMTESYKLQLRADLERYFLQAIQGKRFVALLAKTNNEIAGLGGMVIKEIPGDIYKTTYLEGDILNMYTLPNYRRQGISSFILEALLHEAKTLGISKVALHTSTDGENLYRKYGFRAPEYPYLEQTTE